MFHYEHLESSRIVVNNSELSILDINRVDLLINGSKDLDEEYSCCLPCPYNGADLIDWGGGLNSSCYANNKEGLLLFNGVKGGLSNQKVPITCPIYPPTKRKALKYRDYDKFLNSLQQLCLVAMYDGNKYMRFDDVMNLCYLMCASAGVNVVCKLYQPKPSGFAPRTKHLYTAWNLMGNSYRDKLEMRHDCAYRLNENGMILVEQSILDNNDYWDKFRTYNYLLSDFVPAYNSAMKIYDYKKTLLEVAAHCHENHLFYKEGRDSSSLYGKKKLEPWINYVTCKSGVCAGSGNHCINFEGRRRVAYYLKIIFNDNTKEIESHKQKLSILDSIKRVFNVSKQKMISELSNAR